jgi:hypothetical protein
MDVDPDALITDSLNATTAHFLFVPQAPIIRTHLGRTWRDPRSLKAVGPSSYTNNRDDARAGSTKFRSAIRQT